jgi:GH15 family glucan-1,4-alpha-glucosidase
MSLPLERYAIVGDCRTAALVGDDGSIDWLCLPRFDSSACFAALLGTADHGRWQLRPSVPYTVRRKYRPSSLVLETEFVCDGGVARVIDFMPFGDDVADLVRILEGVRGAVPFRLDLTLRSDYGEVVPWVRRTDDGLVAIAGPDRLRLRCGVPLVNENFATRASCTVNAGERLLFDLTWSPSHLDEPAPIDCERALDDTDRFWREWSAGCTYEVGQWREAVVRSLVTLKALTYHPTGGIVAAVTTSIPEQLGGVRNWDYRYCWLRDATFTLLALMHAGFEDEARAWREWLLRAAAGKPSQVQIMYGLAGERRLAEFELPHLPGYENSRPVRVGNAAHAQFQLDVFGEVMDVLHQCWSTALEPGDPAWRIECTLINFLESKWDEPDSGIWEVRGAPRHFTHSKVMAWVAMDRAVKAVERFGLEGPLDRWKALRDEIHADVCRRGFNTTIGSFVQAYGEEQLDASLLMIPLVGFLPPDDPRVIGTVNAVERHLTSDGFVARYQTASGVDGLPPGEGAFLLCSFWLADNLALIGRQEDALRLFERILDVRSDVGLLSESYDVRAGRLVGNYPQAFSHVGLVNTAHNLSRRRGPADKRREA